MLALLVYVLLTVVVVIGLIQLLIQYKIRTYKRVKNFGPNKPNHLKTAGLGNMFRQVFGFEKREKSTVARQFLHDYGMENKMYHTFVGPLSVIHIVSGDLAKVVYMDPKTYTRKLLLPGTLLHYLSANSFASSTEEFWKPRRALMNPSFANLQNYFPTFVNTIDECLDIWDRDLGKSDEFIVKGLHEHMVHLALDVLGRTVFKYDFGALAHKNNSMHDDYNYLVPKTMTLFHNAFPFWWKLPTKHNRSLQFRIKRFRDSLDQVIKQAREKRERERNNQVVDEKYPYPSLLEAMLDAQDEESGIKMTDEELRDNCFGFFLAGHETTASALTTLLYALAKYPHVQQKIYNEIKEVVCSIDHAAVTEEHLAQMDYMFMAIKENMRLFRSSNGGVLRVTATDTVLGDFKLPKGTFVSINNAGIHMDPEVWENPLEFIPERFSPEESAKRSKFSYIPFGVGPHTCIGNNFSYMEQKLFVAKLLLRFEVLLAPGHETIHFDPLSTLNVVVPEFSIKIRRRQ